MQKDERDLLDALKAELEFLTNSGYACAQRALWRPVFIFEDSPTCINHGYPVNPAACADCPLVQLVPCEFRSAKFPCRHIPLNTAGETVNSLYRYADDHEVEETVTKWLRATIAELEEQRRIQRSSDCERVIQSSAGERGTALHQSAKCANPACPVLFDWRKGGKFFRFRESPNQGAQDAADKPPAGVHGVRHFWLCERCSHLFTLAYEEHNGVILRILAPELTDNESERELPAA
jgi:hypothetical protein